MIVDFQDPRRLSLIPLNTLTSIPARSSTQLQSLIEQLLQLTHQPLPTHHIHG
jgi:hypothetical protein